MSKPPKHGRHHDFHHLVDTHGSAVDALLRSHEADPAAREDLWSEVFTVAYRRLDDLETFEPAQIRAWLLTVTRNVTANHARKATTRRRTIERLNREPATATPSAETTYLDAAPDHDHNHQITAAWNSLTPAHQNILALDANALTGPDIANELGITHQAARSRLLRARRAFLTAFQQCGATQP